MNIQYLNVSNKSKSEMSLNKNAELSLLGIFSYSYQLASMNMKKFLLKNTSQLV